MPLRADNDPKFSRRFLFMGIAALGFAAYCLVDGAIRYPHKQERALAFEKLVAEDKVDQWEVFAADKGWSASIPEESKSEEDYKLSITQQYVMAVVSGLIGAYLVSIPLRARGRWIESTDDGITSSWGQSFKFDDVLNLEKRQWKSKGIAKVTYLEEGKKRRFVIDDYKFDRYKTDAILYEFEQRIDPEKITGGPPEAHDEHDVVDEETLADEAADETSPSSRA